MDSSTLFVNDDASISDLASLPSSSIFSSTPATPCQSNKRKRRIRDTELWSHSSEPRANEPTSHKSRTLFYCKYCINPTHQDLSNTSFRNHLLKQHNINVPLPQKESSRYMTPTLSQSAIPRQPTIQSSFSNAPSSNARVTISRNEGALREHPNAVTIQQALITLITRHNLPSTIVSWPAFRTFLGHVNPFVLDILPTSHTTISRHLEAQFELQKEVVRQHPKRLRVSYILQLIHGNVAHFIKNFKL